MADVHAQHQPFRPGGRTIEVSVTDRDHHRVVGAQVLFLIDGAPAGQVQIGSNRSGPVTIEIGNAAATVEVRASLFGEAKSAIVPPTEHSVTFVFDHAPLFAGAMESVAQCPDGTTGSPCVICRSGEDTWRMCG
jgi:hypothetical protein